MLTITVEDSAFRAYLQELQSRLGDLTPVMDEIGNDLENRIRQRFETRTDPSGAPWHPWAQSTLESYPFPGSESATRSKYGPGNARLLDRYGTMLGGLNYQADHTSVRVGFDQLYAAYHEFGTKHMPRRSLLFADPDAGTLTPGDERLVIELLQEWLAP